MWCRAKKLAHLGLHSTSIWNSNKRNCKWKYFKLLSSGKKHFSQMLKKSQQLCRVYIHSISAITTNSRGTDWSVPIWNNSNKKWGWTSTNDSNTKRKIFTCLSVIATDQLWKYEISLHRKLKSALFSFNWIFIQNSMTQTQIFWCHQLEHNRPNTTRYRN